MAVFSTFADEVQSRHKEMLDELESISIDDLKTDGVSLSFGGKTFKFTEIEIIQNETLEDKLKKEYRTKLNEQQQRIRKKINTKINELLLMHQQKQQELDRKEQQLRLKYQNSAMMPEITEKHLLKGLSVVKGRSNDELTWIYRGIYNPRFVLVVNDQNFSRSKSKKPIPARLVNRMKKEILIIIKTKKDQVTGVKTKKIKMDNPDNSDLPSFSHYHQTSSGDCWGSWSHHNTWSTPDDIMRIAKDAEAVLETINHGSIATRAPAALPKLKTLLDAVEDVEGIIATTDSADNDTEDVWQSVNV
jgi:hypothetical protein